MFYMELILVTSSYFIPQIPSAGKPPPLYIIQDSLWVIEHTNTKASPNRQESRQPRLTVLDQGGVFKDKDDHRVFSEKVLEGLNNLSIN